MSSSFYKIIFALGMLMPITAMAQRPSAFVERGDWAADAGEWEEAYAFYYQAYVRDSTEFDHLTRMATASRMLKEYDESLRMYREAYDKDEGKLFPDGLFWIAMLEKMQGDYESAQRDFRKYTKKINKDKKSQLYQRALKETENCVWALNYKRKPFRDSLTHYTMQGGEKQSENYAWSKNDSVIFSFYKNDKAKWELWSGLFVDSTISNATSLAADSVSLANVCFDGNGYAYFTRCGVDGCGIWRTDEPGLDFSKASPLRTINAPGANSTMPWIAEIGGSEYLFFASNRPLGKGKMDIWIAKKSNDTFINPENAGDIINTTEDELAPHYYKDRLYFSSELHAGFGGQDIFFSKGTPISWGIPENMGLPINSSLNDLLYRVESDSVAYFSSNRKVEGKVSTCCNDIFRIKKKKIIVAKDSTGNALASAGQMTFEELNKVLPVTLYFHNDEPNPRSVDTTTSKSYSETYNAFIDMMKEYEQENTKGLSGERAEDAQYEVNDFFDLKVKKGWQDLELFSRLMLKELDAGRSIRLSVRGFASPRAKSDYNKKLTQRRIQSLANELERRDQSVLKKYMDGTATNGARLYFEALPFGEEQSDKAVSDDLVNTKESIFSRSARLERKIEVQAVVEVPTIVPFDSLYIERTEHDFGRIGKYDVVKTQFVIENKGNTILTMDSVVAACGCTEPVLSQMVLNPGERATIDVGFNPFGARGPQEKELTLYPKGLAPRRMKIRAVVN
ncbi:MAG: DUF1573 domain-containing protein [Flavobacteriales bacterium]